MAKFRPVNAGGLNGAGDLVDPLVPLGGAARAFLEDCLGDFEETGERRQAIELAVTVIDILEASIARQQGIKLGAGLVEPAGFQQSLAIVHSEQAFGRRGALGVLVGGSAIQGTQGALLELRVFGVDGAHQKIEVVRAGV